MVTPLEHEARQVVVLCAEYGATISTIKGRYPCFVIDVPLTASRYLPADFESRLFAAGFTPAQSSPRGFTRWRLLVSEAA
jgi:hypothetical protein